MYLHDLFLTGGSDHSCRNIVYMDLISLVNCIYSVIYTAFPSLNFLFILALISIYPFSFYL